jgi:hypothetical protein
VNEETFKQLYSTKTDEELLSLASERDSLVETARLTLLAELGRRGVDAFPDTTEAVVPKETSPEPPERVDRGPTSTPVWLGLFLLNTVVIYIFALRVSPILVGRWFAWVAPMVGFPRNIPSTDWYLQHLEIVTILPALVAGYFDLGRMIPTAVGEHIADWHSGSAAVWAWTVPCTALVYNMLAFQPPTSVLLANSTSAFTYFFEIQRVMPTFANPLASDPVRVFAQMFVTAPFYAGVAYSLGALAEKHRLFQTIFLDKPTGARVASR